ncbi:PAS domain S-box protein [Bacillus sp. CLL-7-23]|uniref:histidine kinase n=1 Tax=Bacillus changyiensis TaxID=3004103 RepID=A0ABT4X449_9BACI|nr:PAS domain-containing sensor histidine kinase [Bacillus changyiensis]MDA7026211.1 PAS domain S-box protein [Bacillus changyiensis]
MTETLDLKKSLNLQNQLKRLKDENDTLKTELHYYEQMFNGTLDAIFILDEQMNIVRANNAACNILQCEKTELLNRSAIAFLHAVSPEELTRNIRCFLECGYLKREVAIRLDNGSIKYVEFTANKGLGENCIFVVMRDISSKKILERERTMNEKLFKDLFHRAVEGIVIFDKQGSFIDANDSFCQSFEIATCELSNLKLADFVSAENTDKLKNMLRTLYRKGKTKGELPVRLRSGKYRLFELTVTSNILNGFYMSIMRDITEKRLMEKKLFKSEERFREVFENAMDAIIIMNKDWQIVKANQSACKIFELPMRELLTKRIIDFVDLTDKRYFYIRKRYDEKGEMREELQFRMGNGQYKELEFTSKRIMFGNQHLTILRNVSDRKRMEKELRESELKFRKVFNGSMDGIVLFNNQYKIIDANPLAGKILHIPIEQLKSFNLLDVLSEYQIENAVSQVKTISFEEMDNDIPFLLNNQKQILEFSFKRNIIQNMNMAMLRDVTERKELEERLRKSDTLHVVGELAAGIAHEIRNPMTALKGFIQLLEGSIKEEDHSLYFNVITSELKRIESIITEFLILAKPQAIMYEEKNVIKIMQDTMDLLHAQANLDNVQMHLDYYGKIPLIYCEPNQLKQVFINILKNAIEVMPDGGNIYVKIQKKDTNHITVSLTDEGIGMAEDKLKRLGEPFYTTKERGTGLGLMVSYKIIEEHNGEIEVESIEGKGTTFHLTLPIRQYHKEEG